MTIAVLVETSESKPSGYLYERNREVGVSVVSAAALNAIAHEKRRQTIEDAFGPISEAFRCRLVILQRLERAVRTRTPDVYVPWKAAADLNKLITQDQPYRLAFESPAELERQFKQFRLQRSRRKSSFISRIDAEALVRSRVFDSPSLFQELCRETNFSTSARLVMWWNRNEANLASGLFCSSIESALAVLFLLQLALPQGGGFCVACGQEFKRSRNNQRFCSERCKNTFLKRKWRERTKVRVP